MTNIGYALARAELIRTLTAYTGITTANGAADGTTLIDSNLISNPVVVPAAIPEKTILVVTGTSAGEDKGAASFNNVTGAITLQGTGFNTQILAGTIYRILNISSVEIDVANIDTKIGTNVDAAGTTTLFAWLLKLFEHGGQGLVYYGEVTTYTNITHFRVSGLTGFGDDYFANNYRVYVVWDKDGAGAAPQGEMQPCTDYDSTDGIFTHTAFTAPLEVGDKVLLIHERIAEIADLVAAVAIIDGFHDIPGVDAVINAQMRDVIGGKADTPIYRGIFDVSSVIRYLKGILNAKVEAYGTADAGSDADTLVDAALTQGDDYWNGLTLLMLTGANAGLTRPIVAFTDVGNTMELRPAFPANIVATDTYLILSNYHEVVPGVDSAENYSPRDVIGGKADTASETAVNTDSLVSYLKGLLAITGTRAVAAAYATSATGVLVAYAKALVDAGIAVQAAVSDAGPLVGDFDTDLTEASNDHYNGMLMMFLDGNLAGQAHLIDDYVGAAKNCVFAASDQWTEAPANGDKFVLLPSPGAYLKKIYDAVADLITRTKGLDDIHDDVVAVEAKLDAGGLGVGLVTKALTFANDNGQVPLFTVTGDVIVRIVAVVKTGCATGTACNVSVGTAAIVDAIIPVTDITLLAAQEIWHDATPDSEIEALATLREYIISDGNDITLNSSAGDNSGAVTFYCFWTALSSGATVVAA